MRPRLVRRPPRIAMLSLHGLPCPVTPVPLWLNPITFAVHRRFAFAPLRYFVRLLCAFHCIFVLSGPPTFSYSRRQLCALTLCIQLALIQGFSSCALTPFARPIMQTIQPMRLSPRQSHKRMNQKVMNKLPNVKHFSPSSTLVNRSGMVHSLSDKGVSYLHVFFCCRDHVNTLSALWPLATPPVLARLARSVSTLWAHRAINH